MLKISLMFEIQLISLEVRLLPLKIFMKDELFGIKCWGCCLQVLRLHGAAFCCSYVSLMTLLSFSSNGREARQAKPESHSGI